MNMARPRIYFKVLAVWLLVLVQIAKSQDDDRPEVIKPLLGTARDIKLESRIKVVSQRIMSDVVVREFYSNLQKRAWIEIQRMDQETLITTISYYADSSGGERRLMRVERAYGSLLTCKPTNDQELMDDLFGRELRETAGLQGSDWIASSETIPSYFVGAARLLLLAETQRQRLELMPDVSLIRNHKTTRYRLEGNSSLLKATRLFAYYGTNSQHWSSSELPLRMWTVLNTELEVVADFSMIEPIEAEGSLNGERDGLNLFALPLGKGCSAELNATNLLSPSGAEWPRVLSFRAELVQWSGEDELVLARYFVAYDGLAGAARRDAIIIHGAKDFYSVSVYDLWRKLKYNIKQEADKPNRCAAGRLSSEKESKNFFEPLLPFDSMVEMGLASVRSVETVAFELAELKLPELLYPSVLYTDLNGREQMANQALPRSDVDRVGEKRRADLSMIYYFATLPSSATETHPMLVSRSGHRLGPLMRIDVMRHGHLRSRFEVFEFTWQLADAPNGDRQEQLFSLHDKCSQEDGRQGHNFARLALELVQVQPQEVREQQVSGQEALKLIDNFNYRNKALARALAGATQLAPSLVHGVESVAQLQPDKQLVVRATAKLSNQQIPLVQPVVLGAGIFTTIDFETPELNSFEECLWEAAHVAESAANEHLLFTYCLGHCVIDANSRLDTEQAGRQQQAYVSEVFTIGPSGPCAIMGLAHLLQRQNSSSKEFWQKVFANLKSSTLKLPLVGQLDQVDRRHLEQLQFQVKRLEVSDEKWLGFGSGSVNASGTSDDQEAADSIKGVALDASYARRIRPPPRIGAAQEEPEMDLDICQASCLANPTCRSFSLCSSGRKLECMTSGLSFRDGAILTQINSQLVQRGRRLSGTLEIELDEADVFRESPVDGDPSVPMKVSLRLDNRCRLYNRRSMEMFAPTGRRSALMRNHFAVGVASEEECAEKCLRKNMNFFRRTAKLRLLKLQQLEDPAREQPDESQIDLSSWCHSFKYLQLTDSTQLDELKNKIDETKLQSAGLCILSRPIHATGTQSAPSEIGESQLKPPRVEIQVYELQYSKLYERQFGLGLVDTKIDDAPTNRRGFMNSADAETCARLCFSQLATPKPCRSFEFVESRLHNLTATYCVFNTMSIGEARRQAATSKLVQAAPEGKTVWHYEPREGLTLEASVIAHSRKKGLEASGSPIEGASWAAWALLLMALLSGLALGLALDRRGYLRQAGRDDGKPGKARALMRRVFGDEPTEIPHLRLQQPKMDEVELPTGQVRLSVVQISA